MKRFLRYAAGVLGAAVLLTSCATVKPVERESGAPYNLVVLHTNDHHGSTLARPDNDPAVLGRGGLAERAAFVDAVRAANANVLLLDAGDINTGSALSNMFSAEPDIIAYNAMGYDAVTFGNHEFDKDLGVLEKQMVQSRFAWLAANIRRANGKYLGKPYLVKEYPGFRVGILGLTTLRTQVIASPDKTLAFIPEPEAAIAAIKTLREKEKVDFVIILGHLGDVEEASGQITSVKLADALSSTDVALIVDGHSHSKFDAPRVVNGIPIVSANEWGKFVGEAHFTILDGKVANFAWKPVEITSKAFPPDQKIADIIKPYQDMADAGLKEVVMKTSAPFVFGNRLPRYRETAFGDLAADATAWHVRSTGVPVDFAFQNGGNIRAEIPAGDVTREHILTVLPFENYTYVLTLKGSDVIALFDFVGTVNQGAGGFLQVSKEVRYTLTFDGQGKNGALTNLTISGVPVDPNRLYKIATNDYLAGGGDGYTVLTRSTDTYNTSMLLSDVVVEYARTLPQPVNPAALTDGRITVAGGTAPP
ncbi:MAG: 5'-nucleotidase C-terminal domain-containing protein [Spirochaetaceae bacterium]|nr:5'-nucleotidase C-terminal domain-containing protein [Spirochaetaceae bacterium]